MNRAYRNVGGRVLISREGRRFREKVQALLAGHRKLTGPLSMILELTPPDRRRRDADNLVKVTQDSLQGAGLFEDDSQIRRLHVYMLDPRPGHAGCRVTLEEVE